MPIAGLTARQRGEANDTPSASCFRHDLSMNVKELIPSVTHVGRLRPSEANFAPDGPGCFVVTTFSGDVLLIGKGPNIRECFRTTVSRSEDTELVGYRQPVFFHWRLAPNPVAVERAWLKRHRLAEDSLPPLNDDFTA